jgi:hypothetical protein
VTVTHIFGSYYYFIQVDPVILFGNSSSMSALLSTTISVRSDRAAALEWAGLLVVQVAGVRTQAVPHTRRVKRMR